MFVAAVLVAACGSGDDDPRPETSEATTAGGDPATELAVQVASYDLAVGPPSRIIAGVIAPDRRLVAFGTVTMRFAFIDTSRGGVAVPHGQPVEASFLPLPGAELPDPVPSAPQVVTGPTVRGVYAGHAGFDRPGSWEVEVTARVDGRELKGKGAFPVLERRAIPGPGDKALATENLTMASADVPRPAIDSRATTGDVPDPELHRTTIAAALAARRPVVAVFATPVYCTSRFCGPVTEMIEELSAQYGDRATFVHVEIWRDFQNKVLNKSAADWLLRGEGLTEPWVFVIGADGVITHRFDNVASRSEVEPLLRQLPVIGAG